MTRGDKSEGFQAYSPWFFHVRLGGYKLRFGFEYSRVGQGDTPYLDRYILYVGLGTLRLHKFWRGDDDRAPHDHPWWFITFPFKDYVEKVPAETFWFHTYRRNVVRAWRFHYRPADYQHIVEGVVDRAHARQYYITSKPFWTFVITGGPSRKWGFWPLEFGHPKFVGYKDWSRYLEENR